VIRVATWNIRHGRPHHGFASNRRLARAAAMLDVDVLGVQEVERRVVRSWFADQPVRIARAVGASDHRYAAARRLALVGTDGVAICVRGSVLECTRLPIEGRVLLIVRTDVASIACTHLEANADAARRQLDRVLEAFAAWSAPRILLADLNLCVDDVVAPLRSAGFELAGGGFSEPAWDPVQRIDHVAVDGFTITGVTTPDVDVSDHRPVRAELSR
jgi:endonuclease/exonuclease/phosphatase family metal-dependent hydrolase